MVTKEQAAAVMRYLASAYPRAEIPEHTVAVYAMQLMRTRLSADVLLLAAMNVVDASSWFPTVAELLGEAWRIDEARSRWFQTANYWRLGQPLPEELLLPLGAAVMYLGYEPGDVTEHLRESLGYDLPVCGYLGGGNGR